MASWYAGTGVGDHCEGAGGMKAPTTEAASERACCIDTISNAEQQSRSRETEAFCSECGQAWERDGVDYVWFHRGRAVAHVEPFSADEVILTIRLPIEAALGLPAMLSSASEKRQRDWLGRQNRPWAYALRLAVSYALATMLRPMLEESRQRRLREGEQSV